ncbi:MAG TPA: DUF4833 domain-containing protein [Polyangiaceae bacterium]
MIFLSMSRLTWHPLFMLSRRDLHVLASGAALSLVAPRLFATSSRELFRLGRSKNANVVRYAVRTGADGRLDAACPVEAYWLMLAEDGRREELTWTERKLAYGFSVSEQTSQGLLLHLSACSARELRVRSSDGAFRAELAIAGQRAFLQRIFVQTEEGLLLPRVRFVELSGVTARARHVSERIVPR